MNPRAQRRYRIAPHVHACRTDKHLVFLDLKRDRYFGIDSLDADALARHIDGIPNATNTRSEHADDVAATTELGAEGQHAEVLNGMLRDGFLTEASERLKRCGPVELGRPNRALIEGYVELQSGIGGGDVLNFLTASVFAATLVRWRSLEQIVARLRRRARTAQHTGFDIARTRQQIAVFNRLRPFLYSERNACLFSSLAIGEFLARYRIFPQLVFGVATNPFKAHCWLQHGDIVVNDTPEDVREYTPILIL